MEDHRVPVTLLTGFLGSGKTTLLNAVLRGGAAEKVAVIVNEFGEAGLDHDLIDTGGDEVMLLSSGCLCCTVRDGLSRTVSQLFARRLNGDLEFDRIVIETTGLADPGPILQTLLLDSFLAHSTRMDGIVTVVDAANGPATLDTHFEAVSQAAMADLIVMSKTDLVADGKLSALEERLRALNPGARIQRAVRGDGIAARIWSLSALRPSSGKPDVLGWLTGQDSKRATLENLSGIPQAKPSALGELPHDARLGSASITLDDPIADATFDRWLDTLIAMRGADVLRVKGIVFLEGIEAPFVFHGVQHVFDPPVQLASWPKGDRRSRIVVIARDISRPELQRSFDMLRPRALSTKPKPTDCEVLS